jgi:hypothetical protein
MRNPEPPLLNPPNVRASGVCDIQAVSKNPSEPPVPTSEGRVVRLVRVGGQASIAVVRRVGSSFWAQLALLLAIAVAVNWKLVINSTQCVSWGNFSLPCTTQQYAVWASPSAVWQPYLYMGGPTPLPFVSLVASTVLAYPPSGLVPILGVPQTAAWYAVATSFFVGGMFLLYARTFVGSSPARLVAAIFVVAGPFELQLYGAGDYLILGALGVVFLSCYLLWRAVHDLRRRWAWYPASIGVLLVSVAVFQVFVLGFLLYCGSLVIFVLVNNQVTLGKRIRGLAGLVVRFLALPLLLAPLILPSLLSPPFNLGPGSEYANSLTVFSALSASPLSVFFLFGYVWSPTPGLTNFVGNAMVSSAASTSYASIWTGLTVVLIVSIWAGVLVLRDRRGIYLLTMAVLASLFGSGTIGPLGGLNTFLYLHLTGYQELNASYYWDLVIVAPAVALALGVLVEHLLLRQTVAPSAPPVAVLGRGKGGAPKAAVLTRFRRRALRVRLPAAVIGVVVALVITLPYVVNAQNGPVQGQSVGIQTGGYPKDYSEIPVLLSRLIGSSYAGVAVFNPAAQWLLLNSSSVVQNYFYYYPPFRTPSIPEYLTFPYSSSLFSYWVYSLLYTNSSRYVGELLALSGVGYLLVFYGTQASPGYVLPTSIGENASQLLQYQTGIVPIVTAKDFAIYKDLYFGGSAVALHSMSIVAGDYSELDAMAYAGINLTNQGLIFPSDLPQEGCDQLLERVSNVYAASTNALEALALECTAESSSNPSGELSGSSLVSGGWVSSYSFTDGAMGQSVIESWPSTLAVTNRSGATLSVPINVGECMNCSLWIPVRFAADGGTLEFGWGTTAWSVQTNRSYLGLNNTMVWIQLPFQGALGSGSLTVTSLSGWNAVGEVYGDPLPVVESWLRSLENTTPVSLTASGGTLALPDLTSPGQASNYCGLATVEALNLVSLCIQSLGASVADFNVSLPTRESGWLSLLVRSLSSGDVQIGVQSNITVGFDTGDYNFSRFSMGWIRVPVEASEETSSGTLPLRVLNGVVYFSEITFVPFERYEPPAPQVPPPQLSINSTTLFSPVLGFNATLATNSQGWTVLSGNVHFTSTKYNEPLVALTLDGSVLGDTDLAVEPVASPSVVFEVDGARFTGTDSVNWTQFTSSLFSSSPSPSGPTLSVGIYSGDIAPVAGANATFMISLEFATVNLVSPTSDLVPGGSWNVSGVSAGYSASGPPASLVLIRVPYYSNLELQQSGLQFGPALGWINSLVFGNRNISGLSVQVTSAHFLAIGLEVLGVTLTAWILAEFSWYRFRRRRSRRTSGPSNGKSVSGNDLASTPDNSHLPESDRD